MSFSVRSFYRFLIYMSEVLIPALHQGELYNHEKINETGITAVYDTKLLGLVRLRQLRVKNGTFTSRYFIASKYSANIFVKISVITLF